MTIKSAWDIIHFASFDAERQQNKRRKAGSHQRTPGLDMMGYVVRRTYTIIRGRNFVKLRRAILRAQRDLDALGACAVVESTAHYESVGRNQAQRQPWLLPEVQRL